MADGDIDKSSYPISVDADGPAVLPSVAIVTGLFPIEFDNITTQIVNVTGKNGIYKTVVVVSSRRLPPPP